MPPIFLRGFMFSELTTKQKNALIKKGIDNDYKLRRWYPLRYIDNSRETGLSEDLSGKHATVIGTLIDWKVKTYSSKFGNYILCHFMDRKTQLIFSVFFFGEYKMYSTYFKEKEGSEYIIGGMLELGSYGYQMTNPDTISRMIQKNMVIRPVFSKIKGISEESMKKIYSIALNIDEEESVPDRIREAFCLPTINEALRDTYYPKDVIDTINGESRLVFDDMLYFAGNLELSSRKTDKTGCRISSSELADKIISALPYSLTQDQKSVYENIKKLMLEGKPIHSLVQGDVSCGKTIVAFLIMALAAGEGHQSALLAPTKILADQHFAELSKLVNPLGYKVILIENGKYSKKDLDYISSGKCLFVVGTQALLSDKITFCDLQTLVIDEEHKFGVEQRDKLRKKQERCNCISMSATPIPRTLAMSIVSDNMSVFQIKQLPGGRKPVKTAVATSRKILSSTKYILEKGQQIYAVCPKINEDDGSKDSSMSVEKAYSVYKKVFGDKYTVAALTGKTSKAESEQILSDFKEGHIDILVSTTVVEVGVNVPNATLMIVHDADHFGLSGLHQLRGRVGRGDLQSYCLLVTDKEAENKRLSTLASTNDGFEIAEIDMKYLRKTGNIFGDEQSGKNRYIEEMKLNPSIFKLAKEAARQMTNEEILGHIKKIEKCENDVRLKILSIA